MSITVGTAEQKRRDLRFWTGTGRNPPAGRRPQAEHNRGPLFRNHLRIRGAGGPSHKVEKTLDLWYNTLFGIA